MQTSKAPVRVLCVDDNPLVGDGVRIALELAGGFQWLGQLITADTLLEETRRLNPDIILLDIDMPGRDAFAAAAELAEEFPDVRVVIFSGHVQGGFIERAFQAGAWGYLSKSEGTELLASAIRRVAGGEFVLSPQVQAEQMRQ